MSKDTNIQWADSSLNLQMGCEGCELWIPSKGIFKCYAGNQTRKWGNGKKGWPATFETPTLFLDRLEPALKWDDLTGKQRPEKPWMDSLPRIIFLNDMGDTFAASLPLFWMAPVLERIKTSPHQFLLLTKRPSKLVEFSKRYPLPENVWPGTSFTSEKTASRVEILRNVIGGGPKFVSFEPLWSAIPEKCFEGIQWAIFGGESGENNVTACRVVWIQSAITMAASYGVKAFVKQLGSYAMDGLKKLPLRDFHGGSWDEWPESLHLRVRQMPSLSIQKQETLL